MPKNQSILILTVFCFLLLVSGATPAAAENATPFKVSELYISVMPEYDNEQVLIIYGIDFVNTSETSYSGEMRFPVPDGTSNNIVKETANGNHLQVRVDNTNGYPEFVWQPSQPIQPNSAYSIHLEYYYNPLPTTGFKEFAYQFKPSWPVDKSQLYILQPLKAEDIKIEPAAALLGMDKEGFNTYKLDYSALKPGDSINLKVSYTKNDPNPSVKPPSAQNSQFTTQPVEETDTGLTGKTAIIMLSVLAAIISALFLQKKLTRSKNHKKRDIGRKTHLGKNDQLEQEKRNLRQMLLDGEIDEDTYHQVLLSLENDHR